MKVYSNIAISARGQAGHDLWDELTQTPESLDPREIVATVVDFIVTAQMSFATLAEYIDYHNIDFYTLSDIGLQYVDTGKEPLENPTPTEFLRAIVRADLTSYVMEYTLPTHLKQRAENFAWQEHLHSWHSKEYLGIA